MLHGHQELIYAPGHLATFGLLLLRLQTPDDFLSAFAIDT
jgi:hypothetical protein